MRSYLKNPTYKPITVTDHKHAMVMMSSNDSSQCLVSDVVDARLAEYLSNRQKDISLREKRRIKKIRKKESFCRMASVLTLCQKAGLAEGIQHEWPSQEQTRHLAIQQIAARACRGRKAKHRMKLARFASAVRQEYLVQPSLPS